MSRTSRGETETRPVSTRLVLGAEHSRRSATSSHGSWADPRSRRSSSASRRRRTVGLWVLAIYPSLSQLVARLAIGTVSSQLGWLVAGSARSCGGGQLGL